MTYAAQETSVQAGAPVELYLFARGPRAWRFTSAEVSVLFASEVWTSTPISRTDIESTQERVRNDLRVTVPRNNPVAALYVSNPPTDKVTLTVYRYHRGDVDAEAVVSWMGVVSSCGFAGARATINAEAISSAQGNGLRRLYQKPCPHPLYSPAPQCGLNKDDFAENVEVGAISGLVLTVDGLGSGTYAGGFVERIDDDGNTDRRFIRSAAGNALTLVTPFDDLAVNDYVIVYPGCDHTMLTCQDEFNNLPNHGGLSPYSPTKNPFGGAPLY